MKSLKPSVWQTGFAFAILGAVTAFLGLAGIPNPITIASGAVAIAIGLGLLVRLRVAWLGGVAYTVGQLAWIALRFYRGSVSGMGSMMPLAWAALYGYLLVSLVAIRTHYATKNTR